MDRQYVCIDLKSFYASVECVERGLDPMTTDLVVADPERSEKTICLAVSPSLKAKGVKNRCRVFEIPKHLDYITATPRMQKYIDYAAEIYAVYLSYVAAEDIHVYSIDEAFMDVTAYLPLYQTTARELAQRMMDDITRKVGVRATCGIGSNLYLCKVALDITAKHAADFIGELNEESYCRTLWSHRPLTDFWRVGHGTARTLAQHGIFTMGDIAHAPEETLYRLFGIDAELLIDHAWGREPTTIADIKAYKAKNNCLANGQVLMRDYTFDEGRLIAKEMADAMCLELLSKKLVTASVTLHVGYTNQANMKSTHGTATLAVETNEDTLVIPAVTALYDRIVHPDVPVRRMSITCNRVLPDPGVRQLTLFDSSIDQSRTRKIQDTVLQIKTKFGKNAILRGINLEEAATTRERNRQIGGHKSGEK